MKRSLSCISPDGRSTFCLCSASTSNSSNSEFSIAVQFLPFTTTSHDDEQRQRDEERHGSAYTYADNPEAAVVQQQTTKTKGKSYRILLPSSIASRLSIDSPVGLIYCDAHSIVPPVADEGSSSSSSSIAISSSSVHIAIYSSCAVWLLEIAFRSSNKVEEDSSSSSFSRGVVLDICSVVEPFESYLLSLEPCTTIVRLRPSPRRDALTPSGSLAMLTTEGSLVLYHPPRSDEVEAHVTAPVSMASFQLEEDEVVTDFCFGLQPTNALYSDWNPFLGELSVYFLCQNGNIYGAAPIVFDSSAIPTSVLNARIQWMKEKILRTKNHSEAPNNNAMDPQEAEASCRMYCAAQHWMQEIFNISGEDTTVIPITTTTMTPTRNLYSTAHLFRHGPQSSSADWPLQIQGPLIVVCNQDNNDNNGDAVVIEPLPAVAADVFAIGRKPSTTTTVEIQVDLCVLATPVLPRFAFESISDRDILDDITMESGLVLHRMYYDFNHSCDNNNNNNNKEEYYLDIVVDPVTPSSMIHVANSYGICTISMDSGTAAQDIVQPLIERKLTVHEWCCLSVMDTKGPKLKGAVVSEDAQFGHLLIAHLTNDQSEVIDVTASKYLSQLSRLAQHQQKQQQKQPEQKLLKAARNATDTLFAIPQFSTSVAPLIQTISEGLSSMGRLVGSTTKPCDADGTTVATLLQCTTSMEEKVVLPLKELCIATRDREKQLVALQEKQKEQLSQLVEMANSFKEQTCALEKKIIAINETDELLSQRTTSVLEKSRALLPKITEKELEYFTQLKRWEKQCDLWDEKVLTAKQQVLTVDAPRQVTLELSDSLQEMCRALLAGQEVLLNKNKDRLAHLETKVKKLTSTQGLD